MHTQLSQLLRRRRAYHGQDSALQALTLGKGKSADPIAYRRDRRKDQVLQENGYLVLRFLAEDVGKELDLVLDSILRAISHRVPAPKNLLTIVNSLRDKERSRD